MYVLISHIKNKKAEVNLPSNIYSMLLKIEKQFKGIDELRIISDATILDQD